jgi:hypothetical protein
MTHIPVTENMTGGEVTEGVGVVGEVEEWEDSTIDLQVKKKSDQAVGWQTLNIQIDIP